MEDYQNYKSTESKSYKNMDVKQKYIVAPKKITLSIDFIEQLEKSDLVKWESIVAMIERIDNRIDKATSLGHVFHEQEGAVFIEFYFEMRPNEEYLIDYMEIISSDRYLDLILENRNIIITKEKQRWVR